MAIPRYAGVIIDQLHPNLDRIFHYGIPEHLYNDNLLGMRVIVPFGSRKSVQGYIVSLDSSTEISPDKIKDIKELPDSYPVIPKESLPLISWMKEKYHCLYIEAIRCFIPPGVRANINAKTQRIVYINNDIDPEEAVYDLTKQKAPKMADIMNVLAQEDGLTVSELLELSGATHSSLKSLEKKGYIRIEEEETYRNPWDDSTVVYSPPPALNMEQRAAVETIKNSFLTGDTVLLHGVTGSGKTEIYMHAVDIALSMGKQAIVLVPEISLTPQTVGRFKGRFGKKIAVLHSRLSVGERFDEWRRIRNNEADIVVGARSAIFAPFDRIGIIIIDEAHEDTYKSETKPRYHAREIAEKRCVMHGAPLILGTATPSLEDYHKCELGIYKRVELISRVDRSILPEVEIVDMRRELQNGNRSIFSQSLCTALSNCLNNNEQAILLINRRGFAQFVSCRNCGYVVKCKNCDVSLTYHSDRNSLICHYCSSYTSYPKVCPQCGSKYIKHFGLGTQRVEKELSEILPNARIIRMDMDTTSRKGQHYRILKEFESGKYNILLGTQMVAKGLDFPNVTMVGVITADTTLNLPDYRSCEKTFQLITQVSGRAGRGLKKGRVVVQTYQPDHYSIKYASRHDYKGFYNEEISIRKQFYYPPYSEILRILVTGKNEKELIKYAQDMLEWIKENIQNNSVLKDGCLDLGAYPAPLEKIKNKFRWHLLIRIKPYGKVLGQYHKLADEIIRRYYRPDISMALDFKPLSLL